MEQIRISWTWIWALSHLENWIRNWILISILKSGKKGTINESDLY